jgi:hypothetical protein
LILNYRKDGEPFWNLLHLVPLLNQDGNVQYYLGGQIDVTVILNEEIGRNDVVFDKLVNGPDTIARRRQPTLDRKSRPMSTSMLEGAGSDITNISPKKSELMNMTSLPPKSQLNQERDLNVVISGSFTDIIEERTKSPHSAERVAATALIHTKILDKQRPHSADAYKGRTSLGRQPSNRSSESGKGKKKGLAKIISKLMGTKKSSDRVLPSRNDIAEKGEDEAKTKPKALKTHFEQLKVPEVEDTAQTLPHDKAISPAPTVKSVSQKTHNDSFVTSYEESEANTLKNQISLFSNVYSKVRQLYGC